MLKRANKLFYKARGKENNSGRNRPACVCIYIYMTLMQEKGINYIYTKYLFYTSIHKECRDTS